MHLVVTPGQLTRWQASPAACECAGAQDVFREDEDAYEADIQPDTADGTNPDAGSR
jgi:hypothetical protein